MKAQRAAQEAEARRQAELAQLESGVPSEKVPGAFDDDSHPLPPPPAFGGTPITPPPSYSHDQPPGSLEKDDSLMGRLRRLTKRTSRHDMAPSITGTRHTPMPSMSEKDNGAGPRPANQFSPIIGGGPSSSASGAGAFTAGQREGRGTINPFDIQSNVRQAIMACRPTNFNLLQNRQQMHVRFFASSPSTMEED
jgi:hypothetical protein